MLYANILHVPNIHVKRKIKLLKVDVVMSNSLIVKMILPLSMNAVEDLNVMIQQVLIAALAPNLSPALTLAHAILILAPVGQIAPTPALVVYLVPTIHPNLNIAKNPRNLTVLRSLVHTAHLTPIIRVNHLLDHQDAKNIEIILDFLK